MAIVQTVKATVSRVIYPREDAEKSVTNGKAVFTVMLTDIGKAVGMLPFRPAPGVRLSLTGSWEAWHGERNFKFSRCTQDIPQDPHALLEYVCSVGKGLGPKTAEKVWAAHGEKWQENIDACAPATAAALRRTLDVLGANRARLDLAVYCLKIGFSPSVARKAWEAWKDNALATISANPYLVASLPGCGFKAADKAREHFGIGLEDPRRAIAAVDYAVSTAMEQSGDSIVQREAVYNMMRELDVPRAVASLALAKLVATKRVVFVGLDALTSSSVVRDEGETAAYIAGAHGKDDLPVYIKWPDGFIPDGSQEEAVRKVCARMGLSVINGGAGTGKTTIIRAIASALTDMGERVELCAFAGKAAARLREATGFETSTIHSMLGWIGEGAGFRAGSLRGETVIVDEASMVPSSLLYEIAKRSPRRLVLVGDQAQLQPVGIGSPFHDTVDALPSLTSTLDVCHRNKEAVFAAAGAIRNGDIPQSQKTRTEEFAVSRMGNAETIHAAILDMVRDNEIDFTQDLVLSPRNGEGDDPSPCTVNALNRDIQAIVNPHQEHEPFRIGDRVMCTHNFPPLNIWNGTTGWITRIDTDGVPWMLPDNGKEVRLGEREQRAAIVPAYCLTVHKSQGSQYRDVYVCCLRRDAAVLLDRSMLYTAVTRARRKCVILCDDGITRIVSAVHRRKTYLQHLFKGDI